MSAFKSFKQENKVCSSVKSETAEPNVFIVSQVKSLKQPNQLV